MRASSPLDRTRNAAPPSPGPLPPHFAPARRICIVTNELNGLHKNGGIGTANTGLALALAASGFEVTVLYSNLVEASSAELARLRRSYGAKGVALEIIGETPALRHPFSSASSVSYAVYLFARERRFDVIYFHDNCGRGYYSLLAKHTGCYPNAPLLVVVAHGPNEWVHELNSSPYRNKEAVIYRFLERRSIELADALISPSRYLIEWMRDHGWTLPAHTFVEQNIVPMPQAKRLGVPPPEIGHAAGSGKIREIVFFGRMEPRKGILLFFDAIDLLSERLDLGDTQITFLGRFDRIDGLHSGTFVVERSRRWSAPVRILVTKDQPEALDYLRAGGVLAVIPSLAENSPCVVLECLQLGIPFVATDTGGTPELVEPDARERCLCRPEARQLADRLESALLHGQAPAALAVPQADTIEGWMRFHADAMPDVNGVAAEGTLAARSSGLADAPLVSICLVDRAAELAVSYALESILAQDYPNVEILIAEGCARDGMAEANDPPLAVGTEQRNVRRHTLQPGTSLAAARNEIAGLASGYYLLFIDTPDVILLPGGLARLIAAAEKTGARLVSAFGLRLPADIRPVADRDGELIRFPVGALLELGAVENCFGEYLMLIARDSFEQCGGFPLGEDGVIGFWQFWVRALSSGVPAELVPQPAYWYRHRPSLALSRSLAAVSTRATLALLGEMPLSTVAHLLETYVDIIGEQQQRLQDHLVNLRPTARELATRLSWQDANSTRSLEIFVEYQMESGRSREALDFVFDNKLACEAQVRWFKREVAFEFNWNSPQAWQVELRLAQKLSPEHARQVTARIGESSLPVSFLTQDSAGGARMLVTGPASDIAVGSFKLMIGIPAIHRHNDASYQLGYAVTGMTIRPAQVADAPPSAAIEPQPAPSELKAEKVPEPEENRPEPVVSALPAEIEAPVADGFGLVRLDEFYRGDDYRHLDISVLSFQASGQHWPHLKFKFCTTRGRSYLEFRETLDWPVIFVDFPGEQIDAYGPVFQASPATIAPLLPIRFSRDGILFGALLVHLSTIVRQVAQQAELMPAEVEEIVAAAGHTSAELLQVLEGAPSCAIDKGSARSNNYVAGRE
jgi:glycosyltransferase involved in cell wall biosynthesis